MISKRQLIKVIFFKEVLICLLIFSLAFVVYFSKRDVYFDDSECSFEPSLEHTIEFKRTELEDNYCDNAYFVNTKGCKMPSLPVRSKIIDTFMTVTKPYLCQIPMTQTNDQYLWISLNKTELNRLYNVTDIDKLWCSYVPFARRDDHYVNYDEMNRVYFGYGDVVKIDVENIYVICNYDEIIEIYYDYHFFYPKQTLRQATRKSPINVMILGIDSLSRLNFHRQMPKTVEVILDNFNAIELFGYNKLEDNTFPNLMPLLTGLDVDELTKTCLPSKKSTFDSCTFIWEKYKAKGYTTVFADDTAEIGLFNYCREGFLEQPTDFYTRSIIKLLEHHKASFKHGNAYVCAGPHRTIEFLLSYADKFVNYIKSSPYFSFFWTSTYSHDYFNDAQLIDDDFSIFLKRFWRTNAMDNTFLLIMSDHGLRFGEFRNTYQGMMEERQPTLFLIPPKWFYGKYPLAMKNLLRNRHRLTTHFDLHETLQDLADLNTVQNKMIKKRTYLLSEALSLPRAISLFLPIPESRTCADAGILDHWCTCHERVDVATDDFRAKMAARTIIQQINTITKPFVHCRRLVLDSISDAYLTTASSYGDNVTRTHRDFSDIAVRLKAMPGAGEFEATVRIYADKTYERVGGISRTNMYGDQSKCITDPKVKLYCYCDDFQT